MNTQVKSSEETKKAVQIGSLSIFVYLVSYVSRNILSVVTPIIVSEAVFTKEYLGRLSSIYLLMYAAGQLVNGFIGDMIKPKYMITFGCLLSGMGMMLFPFVNNVFIHLACFAVLGFGLSALRGPLMKVIGENTLPKSAQRICVLFSASSFAGPMIASFLSCALPWKLVFLTTAVFAVFMGALAYILLSVFERNGKISFVSKKGNPLEGIENIFKAPGFWVFMVVAVIVEVVASSISFWVPTYLKEYLAYSNEQAAGLYSFISLIRVAAPFIAVFIYQRLIKNRYLLLCIFFAVTALGFLLLPATKSLRIINVALLIAAKIASGCASTMLWSIYIPGLASTGKISTANGIFDLTGYLGASAANAAFSAVMDNVSWELLAVVWALIAAVGIIPAAAALIKHKLDISE